MPFLAPAEGASTHGLSEGLRRVWIAAVGRDLLNLTGDAQLEAEAGRL
jgi:hypothetical protein